MSDSENFGDEGFSSIEDLFIETALNGENILLSGPGGTGKTYFLKIAAEQLIKEGKNVYCTATTGVAAITLSIPGVLTASTLHSWAGVGLAQDPPAKLYAKVLSSKKALQKWRSVDTLIIDEVSMLGGEFFQKLDYVAKRIRRNNEPFGGISVICSGDFLQLPPVKDKWVFQTDEWEAMDFQPFIFEEPKRYPDESHFGMLLRVRQGRPSRKDIEFLHSRVEEFNKRRFHELGPLEVKPTVLYSRRMDVGAYNENELFKLPGGTYTYIAEDTFKPYTRDGRMDDYSKLLNEAIPKSLVFKVGAQVMLKKNLDLDLGLVNGSRGVVTELSDASVTVKFVNGMVKNLGKQVWEFEDKDAKATRTQIPLILAFACTIHTSQGSTLDFCVGELGYSVFSPGQAYVALSRVRTKEGLFLSDFDESSIKVDRIALAYDRDIKEVFDDYFQEDDYEREK